MTDNKEEVRQTRRPLTKEEKRLLRRLRRQSGYNKKSADERRKLDAELLEIAKRSISRKSDETAFAKNVAVAAKHSSRVYFKARWKLLTFFVTASFVLLLTLYVLYAYVFVVDFVEVSGNSRYTSEEILSACGINAGDKLYDLPVNIDELENLLMKKFPYIEAVDVERFIPNRVVITVVEDAAEFVAEIYGEYVLLSEDLRVLEISDVKPEGNFVRIVLPEVKNAVEGELIEFKEDMLNVASAAATAVCSETMRSGTTVLNISDRFGIWIGYEDRYKLMIGDINDIELKLTIAFEIMKNDIFSGGNKGTIYLDNTGSPSVIIDNSITFD